MQFITVGSSWVKEYAYDSGDLYIRYKSGALCHYPNVPFAIWDGLLSASSKGKYIHTSGIKKMPYTII